MRSDDRDRYPNSGLSRSRRPFGRCITSRDAGSGSHLVRVVEGRTNLGRVDAPGLASRLGNRRNEVSRGTCLAGSTIRSGRDPADGRTGTVASGGSELSRRACVERENAKAGSDRQARTDSPQKAGLSIRERSRGQDREFDKFPSDVYRCQARQPSPYRPGEHATLTSLGSEKARHDPRILGDLVNEPVAIQLALAIRQSDPE
jgi:hypothetical protein